jgi:hypothetical protein
LGGNTSPTGAVGNMGGIATAISTATAAGAGYADAYGGRGNTGGLARATVSCAVGISGGGIAVAVGGDGYDPSATMTNADGGKGEATGVTGSNCRGTGGDAPGLGQGSGGEGVVIGPGGTTTASPTNDLGGNTGWITT